MRVILGKRAFDFDLASGSAADPMLLRGAMALFDSSPAGSAAQLRGALAILLLCCPELRAALPMLTARAGWEPAVLGGQVWGVIEGMGGDPSVGVEALLGGLAALRTASAPAPVSKPAPAPERPPEPMPGLSEGHKVTLAPGAAAREG